MKFIEDGSTRDGRVLIRSSAPAKRGEYNKNEWKKEKEREREKKEKGLNCLLYTVGDVRSTRYLMDQGNDDVKSERSGWLLLARLSSGSAALRGTKELRAKGRRRRTTEKRINHGWKDKKGAREREREREFGADFFLIFLFAFFAFNQFLWSSFFSPSLCVSVVLAHHVLILYISLSHSCRLQTEQKE